MNTRDYSQSSLFCYTEFMKNTLIILLIFGAIYYIFFSEPSNQDLNSYNYNQNSSYSNTNSYYNNEEVEDCSNLEPENPYSSDGGHYAGFEWAQNNGVSSCGGNSESFIEGCEEYLSQEEVFETCESNK